MSKYEEAKNKSRLMVKYMEGQEIKEPLEISIGTVVGNFGKFLDSHKMGLENNKPLSRGWMLFYMRLYDAKQAILKLKQEEK